MKSTARTVVFDYDTPVEATVTATRTDGAKGTRPPGGDRAEPNRSQLLKQILAGTGVPADGWHITTEPPERLIHGPAETTAALAAILRASGKGEAGSLPEDAIFTGLWTHGRPGQPTKGWRMRGSAIQARFAAQHNRPLVAPDRATLPMLLPRNHAIRFNGVENAQDLLGTLNGHKALQHHEPDRKPTPEISELTNGYTLNEIPTQVLRNILPALEHACSARQPVLFTNTAASRTTRFNQTETALRLAVMLLPALTPDEEQIVLETYDLAGTVASGCGKSLIQRPIRSPHWTTTASRLRSTRSRPRRTSQTQRPRLPSELDLAGRGAMTVELTEGFRLDRNAGTAVVNDWLKRTDDRYILISLYSGSRQEAEIELERTHPLAQLPYDIAAWPVQNNEDRQEVNWTKRATTNERLVQDARTRVAATAKAG